MNDDAGGADAVVTVGEGSSTGCSWIEGACGVVSPASGASRLSGRFPRRCGEGGEGEATMEDVDGANMGCEKAPCMSCLGLGPYPVMTSIRGMTTGRC